MELAQEILLSFLKSIWSSCKEPHTVLGVNVKWRIKEDRTKSLISKGLHSIEREE